MAHVFPIPGTRWPRRRWPDGWRRELYLAYLMARLFWAGGVVLLALLIASSLQTSQAQPASPIDAAEQAMNFGQFDEVEELLEGMTDPQALTVRARADVARGRYEQAEAALTPLAAAGPGSDAALELGKLQMILGRRAEASRILQGVLTRSPENTAADLMRIGLAARALGRFQDANDYLRDASRLAPDDAVVHTTWGELFLEKYDRAEAVNSFQAALEIDETYVRAQVNLARAIAENNPPAALEAVEQALELNPRSVPAHLLFAELALNERRRDDARAAIGRALAVNPRSLEALALDAAIPYLEGRQDEFEAKAAAILEFNPVYADAYRVAGDHAARNYLFEEAVALTRRALAIDDASTRAHADLGLHLLRTGDEAEARRELETAFEADPFDIVTFNLLTMMDTLDTFETFREGDVILRLHPEEAAVMREQVMPLALEALETLSAQYDFEVRGPILIEMFPKHDDFAVRTIGLPGFIGALGACFGRVVTLDSPRARPPGQFSWRETLWHEIAHVITLQMSNNRLPRWLSEGLSVFEERRARPEWGREMEVSFAQALEAERTLPLRDLNEGFSDPAMISLAYYEASLVVEHLVETYGEPALREFLRAYGRGLETDDALQAAYGVTLAQMQASFDEKMQRDFAAHRAALQAPEIAATPSLDELRVLVAASPDSFRVQMEFAQALHEAGDGAAAIEALERASALLPRATGANNPNALIALIATEQGDADRTIEALEALVAIDHTDVESARRLAMLLDERNETARASAAYRLVADLDPFDGGAQSRAGRFALEQRQADAAIRAFRSALAVDPIDRVGAHFDLGEAYFLAGRMDEAKAEALAALELAPSFERAQDLLLKIVDAQ